MTGVASPRLYSLHLLLFVTIEPACRGTHKHNRADVHHVWCIQRTRAAADNRSPGASHNVPQLRVSTLHMARTTKPPAAGATTRARATMRTTPSGRAAAPTAAAAAAGSGGCSRSGGPARRRGVGRAWLDAGGGSSWREELALGVFTIRRRRMAPYCNKQRSNCSCCLFLVSIACPGWFECSMHAVTSGAAGQSAGRHPRTPGRWWPAPCSYSPQGKTSYV
jgi:hypothetical protein